MWKDTEKSFRNREQKRRRNKKGLEKKRKGEYRNPKLYADRIMASIGGFDY